MLKKSLEIQAIVNKNNNTKSINNNKHLNSETESETVHHDEYIFTFIHINMKNRIEFNLYSYNYTIIFSIKVDEKF